MLEPAIFNFVEAAQRLVSPLLAAKERQRGGADEATVEEAGNALLRALEQAQKSGHAIGGASFKALSILSDFIPGLRKVGDRFEWDFSQDRLTALLRETSNMQGDLGKWSEPTTCFNATATTPSRIWFRHGSASPKTHLRGAAAG